VTDGLGLVPHRYWICLSSYGFVMIVVMIKAFVATHWIMCWGKWACHVKDSSHSVAFSAFPSWPSRALPYSRNASRVVNDEGNSMGVTGHIHVEPKGHG
jgi:hypothetical protein